MITTGRTQRRLLWLCLGSIALCAVVGVATILIGSPGPTTGRIFGTAMLCGMAALLALPAATAAERGRWSPIGPLAILLNVVGLAGALFLIWIPWNRTWGVQDPIQSIEDTVMFTCSLATVAAICATLAFARVRRGYRWVIPATIIAMIVFCLGIWWGNTGSSWGTSAFLTRLESLKLITALTVITIPAALILARRGGARHSVGVWFRWLTAAVAMPLVMTAVAVLAGEDNDTFDVFGRVMAISGILSATGLIAAGVMHRMTTITKQETVFTTRLDLRLFCPRCGSDQTLPAGHCSCKQCGLKMRIEIEEEQCGKCGYVLFGLASANCPECGAVIVNEPSPGTEAGSAAVATAALSAGGA
ncbi:MAG: hypothetical protein SF069_18340 [Phycisphaerae bacterium]|nr:hypothetical protein [Phycisphaerae bacterium]